MSYDQNYYPQQQQQQPQQQRPYNGRADRRPGPHQGYNQGPPQQQYAPQQQYDQYPQEGYGYDDGYDNGYGQEYNGHQGMSGGGRGNGYPPQNAPPRQEYYGNEQRGGMPSQQRGGGGGGRAPPMQRPPAADGGRGGYDLRGEFDSRGGGQNRGNPNFGPRGGGGRPGPPDRTISSDPGSRQPPPQQRRPLKTPPMSPETLSYDNPFPTFPGAKKKTSVGEEREILQKMQNMEIGASPQGYANNPSGRGFPNVRGNGRENNYGRPSLDNQRRPPPEGYGRPSLDTQRSMPGRGYPHQGQQGYPEQRRGPPNPNQGFALPTRKNTYEQPGYNDRAAYGSGQEEFGPPSRSQTMPSEASVMARQYPPVVMDGPGPSAPYNGPIGRTMPPRPSTASGNRQPPQRQYQDPVPMPVDSYASLAPPQADINKRETVSDFYDAYYEPRDSHHERPPTSESELPNFDSPVNAGSHRRGASIDGHLQSPLQQLNGNQAGKPAQLQPTPRGLIQSQTAIFEMVGDLPPSPAYPPQNYQDDGHGNDYYQEQQRPPLRNNGGYTEPPPQAYTEPPPQANGFAPPPRSASAAPRSGPQTNGLPSGGPRPGFNGAQNGMAGGMGPGPNAMNAPRIQSAEGLPSHPTPVRAGLIPGSVAAQAVNRPPPVRNYNDTPTQAQVQAPPTGMTPQAVAQPPAMVSVKELEELRSKIKANPTDQESSMLLVRKLVEAAKELTPLIADPKQRVKAREKYVIDAFKLLRRLTTMGNTDAMFYLADCYGRGALGLATDTKEAFTLYQSAAKAGHAGAAYRTAVCCELGSEEGGGTRKDPAKAIQWYKRAATLMDTPAMYKMGMIQLKGLLGQPQDVREAVGWLKRAAERADPENPHALHELALLYEKPQDAESSIIRDEAYSFQLFEQAAHLGYKFSQFRLGCAFEYGLFNCPIDPKQSIMWYSRAAAQEEHQSELALSGWYLTGSEGVLQQSDTEAYLWARKAGMAGLAKAEYAMGYFTEVGIGSPANLEDAKRWYWRAAAQNFPKARERLEDLKRNGGKAGLKSRERISRSKVGKDSEGECAVM